MLHVSIGIIVMLLIILITTVIRQVIHNPQHQLSPPIIPRPASSFSSMIVPIILVPVIPGVDVFHSRPISSVSISRFVSCVVITVTRPSVARLLIAVMARLIINFFVPVVPCRVIPAGNVIAIRVIKRTGRDGWGRGRSAHGVAWIIPREHWCCLKRGRH